MLTFQHLKRYTAIFCFAGVVSMPSLAGVHVDVNIGVGSPGYYGVLPIQGVTPSLWNANPIVAIGAALAGAPIYLTVPDKHRRHWKRYCAEYGACGVPVYFVRRGWYNNYYGHAAPPLSSGPWVHASSPAPCRPTPSAERIRRPKTL